jgi:eukaryotic-like serine/threonine-protein kinase
MVKRIGKYQIVTRIGRGAMGDVYKAHDPVLDRLVALKVISGEIEVTDDLRARFFREAQAGAKLAHPNIVTVHDLAEEDGQLFIVMEFLEGEELRQLIGQRRNLGLEHKLSLMLQACDGLGYAHARGIIHRDIKPGNIFVLATGRVKLLDFGIARLATGDPDLTRTGFVMGTLRYMSPEQSRGRVDKRSDIFSLGAVFYELLTYKAAFPGDDPMEIMESVRLLEPAPLTSVDPALPADLGEIIARALRKDPAQRFPDLSEMRQAIAQVQFRIVNEAESARRRLDARVEELRELERTVARQGGSPPTAVMPTVGTDADIRVIVETEREVSARLERLRAQAAQTARLDRAVDRGWTLLADGDAEAALRAFERVLGEVPDHARALEGAREARLAVDRARATAQTTVYAADHLERGEMTSVTQVVDAPAELSGRDARARRRSRLPVTLVAIAALAIASAAAIYGLTTMLSSSPRTARETSPPAPMVGSVETTPPTVGSSPPPADAAGAARDQPAASPPAAEPTVERPVTSPRPRELPARDTRQARDVTPAPPRPRDMPAERSPSGGRSDHSKVANVPPSSVPERAPTSPNATASPAPTPDTPAPRAPKEQGGPSPSRLPADAGLEATLKWLASAVNDRAGQRGRVRYGAAVHTDCSMEWHAEEDAGGGYVGQPFKARRALSRIDSSHTGHTAGDGGWIVNLPLTDGTRAEVVDQVFKGFVVWFKDEKTASEVAAGFQQAIKLCAQ